MKRLLIIFALVFLVSADHHELVEPAGCDDRAVELLLDGNDEFTGRFLYNAVTANPKKSSIMSAYSVLTPLAQLGLYAKGNTLSQILDLLNLPDKASIRCVFPRLINQLRDEQNVVLNEASRIFVADRYPLSENFATDTKEVFDAEAENINFLEDQGQVAADRINEWVAEQTNDRIQDLATPDMFDEDTRLALVNAIYFLGNWNSPFDKYFTTDRPFNTVEKTEDIPTMYQEDYFKYGESSKLDCKILEMFYEGHSFSFVVFLPNKIDGLIRMVEKLRDPQNFYDAYANTRFENVQVYLPKMKIESSHDLAEILRSVGVKDIFNRRTAKLNGILRKDEPLYISKAKQMAFIEADETGTEAAAANLFVGAAITSIGINPPPPKVFKADKPYVYYIMNNNNKQIFCGHFTI